MTKKLLTKYVFFWGGKELNDGLVWFMVFNATYNNISVILWGGKEINSTPIYAKVLYIDI